MTSRRVLLFVLAASLTDCKSPTAPASAAVSPPSTAGRHIVTVPGDGVALGGILFPPEAAGVRPAIVVLHGWQPAGTNGAAVVEARARQYAEAGYVARPVAAWLASERGHRRLRAEATRRLGRRGRLAARAAGRRPAQARPHGS